LAFSGTTGYSMPGHCPDSLGSGLGSTEKGMGDGWKMEIGQRKWVNGLAAVSNVSSVESSSFAAM